MQEPFAVGPEGLLGDAAQAQPDQGEQISGLARVLRGNAQAALENVALWHERDISHSSVERVILPDSTILLDYLQHRTTALVRGMSVDAERMRANLELTHGALFSQRVLLALVEAGPSRDDAYRHRAGARAARLGRGDRRCASCWRPTSARAGSTSTRSSTTPTTCATPTRDRRAARTQIA